MTFKLSTFQYKLKSTFKQIKKSQAESLSIEIAANYTAGRTAAAKHQSTKSLLSEELDDDEGLTTEEKAEIALLVALFLGYINKFNDVAQDQIISQVKTMVKDGKTADEIRDYVQAVFSGEETIIIDNVGKTKKEIYVDKNLKLSEVSKTIEKPFYASVLVYASLLGENAAHRAYEAGRTSQNKIDGFDSWVFAGPADERARPWHIALLGQVYKYGTVQSEYAESCLREPRCRHRAQVYFGDSRDVPAERWEKLKKDVGLHWDDEKMEWSINI